MNNQGNQRNNTGGNIKGNGSGDIIPKGYNKGQLSQYTPEQNQLLSQMFGHVDPDSYLSKLSRGDEGTFDELEEPQHRQFNEQISNMANRFSGAGTGGRHSSGFKNATTAASSNFAQDLASQRQGLMRQAMQDLTSISSTLLDKKPEEKFLVEKPQKQNVWGDIGGKFAAAIPQAVANYASGGTAAPK